MKRPGWWPEGWAWPGAPADAASEAGAGPRPVSRREPAGRGDAAESFLRVLLEGFAADRVVVYRLARDRERWIPERRMPRDSASLRSLEARGHPLTWCARERLIAQIPMAEVPDGPGDGAWLLAAGLPGGERVLVLTFAGTPPPVARRGMQAVVDHLVGLPLEGTEGGRTN